MASGKKTGGRKAGTPNRFTMSVKEAFLSVYDDLQKETGEDNGHLFNWAKENPTDFYKICAKMIPQQVNADINHVITANDLSDDELVNIATGSSAGAAKQTNSKKSVH